MQPAYFIRHPNGDYSLADPQPVSIAHVAMCNCGSKREGLHSFDCPITRRSIADREIEERGTPTNEVRHADDR